jgi:hypothetical protein
MAKSAAKPVAGESGEKEKIWVLQDGHSHRIIATEMARSRIKSRPDVPVISGVAAARSKDAGPREL